MDMIGQHHVSSVFTRGKAFYHYSGVILGHLNCIIEELGMSFHYNGNVRDFSLVTELSVCDTISFLPVLFH
jgi:hypothetical protein